LKIRSKGKVASAGVNASRNLLFIDESFLARIERGEVTELETNATLAHEFGHLIECAKHTFRKSDQQLTTYIAVLLIPLLFYFVLQIPDHGVGAAVIVSIWILMLPWVLRKIYVPNELAADSNAVLFSLISDQDLANAIVNRIGSFKNEKIGPKKILNIIDNIVSHPFLDEHLANIGFEIKRPLEAKRIKKQSLS
jgi:hypothetical protein